MDQEKALSLLKRQVKDIESSADKILNGEDSAESIEAYARYSAELKQFVRDRIASPKIVQAVNEIAEINYARNKTRIWQFLILPYWWISLYKDYHARQKSKEEIVQVKGQYASLYFLLQKFNLKSARYAFPLFCSAK